MKCYNCEGELDPTLIYCNHCGVATDTEPEDIYADAEEKTEQKKRFAALTEAKSMFVTACFLLACTVGLRMVLLKQQNYEHLPAYRVPRQVVDDEGYDPPVALDVQQLVIPLPN
jgi:hypothetical protein